MKPIAILGAGNSGLAMAEHLAMEGYPVRLWNRGSDIIEPLLKSRIQKSVVLSMEKPSWKW